LNETLKLRDLHVNNLVELSDGVVLCNFLEILSQKRIPTKIELKPVNKIQKITNLAIALKFFETDMGFRNPGCSAEDIVDIELRGIKLVLGLLWVLYRKYRIAVITHQDKKEEEGLLLWCKNVTTGYHGVQIENFKTSFKDGLAFLALVHRYSPDKTAVVFDNFSKDAPELNLTAAFDLAEKELGIPKLLDVKEVMDGKVDERSLVLYTSLFFHAFRAAKVAEDLEKARLGTEELLTWEKKKNEQLTQKNLELEQQIEELKLEFSNTHKKLEEEHTLNLEFETKIQTLTLRFENLEKDLHQKEEVNIQFSAEKVKLEEVLTEVNLKFENFVKETGDKHKDTEKKGADDASHIQELKKKNTIFEEEIESLRNEVDNFKIQLENEKRDKDDHHRIIVERTEQDNVHRKGLQVLRRNLDQHIEDLHIWQKYLGSADRHFLDFDREVRPHLDDEINGKDFVDQLNILSGKLDGENEIMLRILKTKAAELKAAEVEAVKAGKQ